MTVFIFQTERALIEFLASERNIPAVFDFSRSENIRELYSDSLLNPFQFSPEQKEKILDEYIEIISELGRQNSFSIPWLCHPISEKNDLLPDTLFKQLIDFLHFCFAYASVKKREFAVLAADAVLIRNIRDFLAEENIKVRIMCPDPDKRRLQSAMKDWIHNIFSNVKCFVQIQIRFINSRHLKAKLDKSQIYTIVRTWFDSRSPSLLRRMEDVYFGKLPHYLQSKGFNVLYFGDFIEGFTHVAKTLMENRKYPLLLQSAYIHGIDFVKAVIFQRNIGKKIQLKSGLQILDFRVDCVFKNYLSAQSKNLHIRTNYLTYTAVKKLLKKLKVDRFYMPFENYAWEKLTRMAIRSVAKDTKVISFQHSQVALNSTKYFLGKAESRALYLPDKILTLGSVTRDFLVHKKNYPKERLIVGGALRHEYVLPHESVERRISNRVLVLLWTFQKSVRMVNFFLSFRDNLKKYDISIGPHPSHPMTKLMPYLNSPLMKDYKVVDGPLSKNINSCDAVVYHGTTACLDALAHGRPVINIEFDDFISPDPLFDFHDFKWNARTPEELVKVLDDIFLMSDTDYYLKQKSGFDFVGRYFWPVGEKGLSQFLRP